VEPEENPQPVLSEMNSLNQAQELFPKEEFLDTAVFVNGFLSNNLPDGSVQSPGFKSPSPVLELSLTKEELRRVSVLNLNMRQMIFKEVKRPGKNHDRLFEMLRDLHGPPCVRHNYIQDVIREARRFKRDSLVYLIEQEIEKLVTTCETTQTQVTWTFHDEKPSIWKSGFLHYGQDLCVVKNSSGL